MTALVVIAKAPVPGRSKTRLCPPFSPVAAAALAEAALRDSLAAVLRTACDRRVLVLEGEPGGWLPQGFELLRQRGGGLEQRLAAAFADVGGPALLIAMDTPQVTPGLLRTGLAAVARGAAALGRTVDGGYWAIGLPAPDARVFAGIPMSAATTGSRQRSRLAQLGYRIHDLPPLRDVDTAADARAVAEQAPGTAFATTLQGVRPLVKS